MIGADLACALDPVLFARAAGVTPDPWQADLLRMAPRRGLLLCSRQSGKTTTTGLLAAHRAVYETRALVIIVSPSQDQSGEMLRSIKTQLGALPDDIRPAFNSESVLKIELANGSRILARPGSEKSTRGFAGASLIVIDEASRVDDDLLTAVRPMLATRMDGSLIALTTPNGKRGFFYEAWIGGDPMWHRVSVSAKDCPRISPEFLDEELRSMGPTKFKQEYELEFVDDLASAFPTDIIDRAFTNEVTPLWI